MAVQSYNIDHSSLDKTATANGVYKTKGGDIEIKTANDKTNENDKGSSSSETPDEDEKEKDVTPPMVDLGEMVHW